MTCHCWLEQLCHITACHGFPHVVMRNWMPVVKSKSNRHSLKIPRERTTPEHLPVTEATYHPHRCHISFQRGLGYKGHSAYPQRMIENLKVLNRAVPKLHATPTTKLPSCSPTFTLEHNVLYRSKLEKCVWQSRCTSSGSDLRAVLFLVLGSCSQAYVL